jgi:hypothetical protein
MPQCPRLQRRCERDLCHPFVCQRELWAPRVHQRHLPSFGGLTKGSGKLEQDLSSIADVQDNRTAVNLTFLAIDTMLDLPLYLLLGSNWSDGTLGLGFAEPGFPNIPTFADLIVRCACMLCGRQL